MVFLTLCVKIADSTLLFWLGIAALIPAFGIHSYITSPLAAFPDGRNLPDGRITGYTPAQLNQWYDQIGVQGCHHYIRGANWDFGPIMMTYPLVLGSLLVRSIRASGSNLQWAYLPLLAVVCDAVETYLQRQGCIVYPQKLSDRRLTLASRACCLKWVWIFASLGLIAAMSVRGRMTAKTTTVADAKTK